MLAVDTSVWVDYLRGVNSPQAILLDREIARTIIIVPDLVLVEILRGLPDEISAQRTILTLLNFSIKPVGGTEIAMKAAMHYRYMRSLGVTIRGTIDLLIATWCIENDVPLLHSDRDFVAMSQHIGLKSVPCRTN